MDRLAFVTGTRAEFGLLLPVADACARRGIDIEWIACGQHLSSAHGDTIGDVERSPFRVAGRVETLDAVTGGSDVQRERGEPARSAARGIEGIAQLLEEERFEGVVVLGDRTECFAGATAGALTRRVVAHIHGGDLSGGLDECMRHATTKLAHVHFAATRKSGQRIEQLGEDPARIHVVGAPGLDVVLRAERVDAKRFADALAEIGAPDPLTQEHSDGDSGGDSGYVVVLQHSDSNRPEAAAAAMAATLEAVVEMGLTAYVARPNSDPGGLAAREVIEATAAKNPMLHVFSNLPHEIYLELIRRSRALVGNSSSGIIEAPSLGIPVVDIGTRQRGRECATTVRHVEQESDADAIASALRRALAEDRRQADNPYGDGSASERIATVLHHVENSEAVRTKRFFGVSFESALELEPEPGSR